MGASDVNNITRGEGRPEEPNNNLRKEKKMKRKKQKAKTFFYTYFGSGNPVLELTTATNTEVHLLSSENVVFCDALLSSIGGLDDGRYDMMMMNNANVCFFCQ